MNSASSKAQIPQVFIFLMALLVIGATVFVGMRMLGGLTSTACTANNAVFQQEIKHMLDERSTFGYSDTVSLKTPCDAIALCFVDNTSIGDAAFSGNDTIINSAVRNNVRTNIFLQTRDTTLPVGYDARIALAQRPSVVLQDRCIAAVSGKFTFSTKGYGRYILIAP